MRNSGNGIARLDVAVLYDAIQKTMAERGLTSVNAMAKQSGLSGGAVNRMHYGVAPDSHNLCAILSWLGESHWWMAPPREGREAR